MKISPDQSQRLFVWLSNRWVIVSLLIITVLIWLAITAVPEKQLKVSFLDVGQGDATFIQTPSRQQILIDGGPDPENICISLGDQLPFWDKSLDLLVLTHTDDDHVTGLLEVMKRYKVKRVLWPGLTQDTPACREWLRLIQDMNIEQIIAVTGQKIKLDHGIEIEVIHPQQKLISDTESDINNNSAVLRLVWDDVSFLFSGDIEEEAEREILFSNGYSLASNVLKLAHHGSESSTSPHFLAAVDPQIVIISVGEDNTFGHPNKEVLTRLKRQIDEDKIFITAENGTVQIKSDGHKLWVSTDKP